MLNGRLVSSGFSPAHNAASGQCKYAFRPGSASARGQPTGAWPGRPCREKDILELHLFIVAGGKLIGLLNLFLKIRGKSLYLVLFVEQIN